MAEPVETEVVDDRQVGRQEAAEGLVHGAVDAGPDSFAAAAVGRAMSCITARGTSCPILDKVLEERRWR